MEYVISQEELAKLLSCQIFSMMIVEENKENPNKEFINSFRQSIAGLQIAFEFGKLDFLLSEYETIESRMKKINKETINEKTTVH